MTSIDGLTQSVAVSSCVSASQPSSHSVETTCGMATP